MKRTFALVLVAMLLAVPIAFANPVFAIAPSLQNDAGSGGDAPNSSGSAMNLPLGTYGGDLDYLLMDNEDWYRFVVPAGTTLRFTFRAITGGMYGGIHNDDGSFVKNAYSSGATIVQTAGAGAYKIGLGDHLATSGTASYTFTVDFIQNDANLGRDAGSNSGAADGIAFGTYTGALAFGLGDKEDWYRVVVPTGGALRFTFRATSGGMYGGIHNDDGSFITNAYSNGNTVTLTAGAGAYRLGLGDHLATSGTASYTFTVGYQNDANLGRDAGSNSGAAENVAPGTYSGAVFFGDGDNEDWYRVTVPAGTTLKMTFTATSGGLYGGIHNDADGSMVVNAYSSGNQVVLTAGAGTFRLGFGDHLATSGYAHYTFTAEFVQNDANLGRDAGSNSGAAEDLALGTYSGNLFYGGGDKEDWYRVTVPAGTTLRLTFTVTSPGAYGGIHRDSDGSMVVNAHSSGNQVVLTAAAGTYRIGFGNHLASSGSPTYSFTAEAI